MVRLLILVTALVASCADPDPPPPQQYVPGDRGDATGGDSGAGDRRAPGERRGGELVAGDSLPPHWECNPLYYNTRDGCDCGCGIPDPDCEGLGCATPGCDASACQYCHVHDGMEYQCGGTPPPADWACSGFYYGDGECDCGCTAADADCGASGCTTPGCADSSCSFCWDGADLLDCSG